MKKQKLYEEDEEFLEKLFASEANNEVVEDLSLKQDGQYSNSYYIVFHSISHTQKENC